MVKERRSSPDVLEGIGNQRIVDVGSMDRSSVDEMRVKGHLEDVYRTHEVVTKIGLNVLPWGNVGIRGGFEDYAVGACLEGLQYSVGVFRDKGEKLKGEKLMRKQFYGLAEVTFSLEELSEVGSAAELVEMVADRFRSAGVWAFRSYVSLINSYLPDYPEDSLYQKWGDPVVLEAGAPPPPGVKAYMWAGDRTLRA